MQLLYIGESVSGLVEFLTATDIDVLIQAFMLLLVWNASNLGGHTKKVTLVLYCASDIAGAESVRASEAPGYISEKSAIMAVRTPKALCRKFTKLSGLPCLPPRGFSMLIVSQQTLSAQVRQ